MKRISFFSIIVLLLLGFNLWAFSLPLVADNDKEIKKLDKKYQKWLQDVEYILTKREREAFLKMPSDQMRNLFIKNFWEVRDPTPGTPRNEFKDEHYKRLEYANKYLGRETFRPGWKTDRGKMYILLGEPRDIQRFPDSGVTYPCELWFYDAGGLPGLSPFFYLIFFKRYGTGEFELYSPLTDGPQALLTLFPGDPTNYQEPYKKLQEVSAELARASLSLDPSDPIDYFNMRPSLGSEMLLAKIYDLPNRLVNPGYVKNMLDGIPTVEVKYVFKSMELGFFGEVYQSNEGDYFFHYAIQIDPQHLNVGKYKDKIYTTIELKGDIKDEADVSISKISDQANIEFSEEKFEKVKFSPFAIEGKTLVLPGEYTLTLMVINKVSKEYGTIEKKIIVPQQEDKLQISTPILASNKKEAPKNPFSKVKPFTFDKIMLIPNIKRIFPLGSLLYLYFQVALPKSKAINTELLEAKYFVLQKEKVVWEGKDSLSAHLSSQAETFSLLKPIPLNFGLGNYQLKISLYEGEEEKLSSDLIDFQVLNPREVPFPSVYAKNYPPSSAYQYNVQKAMAYLAKGNRLEAIKELRIAHNKAPDFQFATKSLAQLLLESKQYQAIVDLLKNEIIKKPNDYDYILYLAISYAELAEYYDAIRFYERARLAKEPTSDLLNALGEVYLKAGNKEKAKEIFSQSLEINPDQPKLKEFLKGLGN